MSTREWIGKNETLFRELNDRITEVSTRLFEDGHPVEFICECGREGCLDRIRLTLEEVAAVRRDPTHFFVLPGHELEEHEDVVARLGRYTIVAKPWLAG